MADETRVVVAHEEPMITRILKHKLRREGYDVRIAHDRAALNGACSEGVDVLLLDLRLHDGAAPAASRGWFAIVEAGDTQAQHEAMTAGAAGLVRTPFKPTDVAAQVAALLAMAHA